MEQTMNTSKRIVLGARYNLRVEDFGKGEGLELECLACGGHIAITATALKAEHPGYARIKELAVGYRCTDCGQGNMSWWPVAYS